MLAEINSALGSNDTHSALRYVDRLRRTHPDNALILHLSGRILGRCGDFSNALAQLDAAATTLKLPEIEASAIEILLQLNRDDEALRRLVMALDTFAVTPELRDAARAACGRLGPESYGWVGMTPALELQGEIFRIQGSAQLNVRNSDGDLVARFKTVRHENDKGEFSIAIPSQPIGTRLTIHAEGATLIGSSIRHPPAFRIDGRATMTKKVLTGWVSVGWLPGVAPKVLIEGAHGARETVTAEPDPVNPGRHKFEIDLAVAVINGPEIVVSVVLPDGTSECLPDTPLLLEQAAIAWKNNSKTSSMRSPKTSRKSAKKAGPLETAVIVPVYLGLGETRACLDSLVATVADGTEIIVIDDASPDQEISQLLDRFAASGHITLLRNAENIGFAASVNRGIAFSGERDVVVVNSDVVVHRNWLERIRSAAYQEADIGTVTPLTDDGTVVSYPAIPTLDNDVELSARLDSITAIVNAGVTVDLPVGIGFCLFIRHECFADTGTFDTQTFKKGYGEETDFCMRARARGWRHVVAGNVFVHHTGGSSFGARREALLERSTRITDLRYPGYDAFVQKFINSDALGPVRRRIDQARLLETPGRFALLVSHALGGGVTRHVAERADRLREQGLSVLILEPSKTNPDVCVLRDSRAQLAHLNYSVPDEVTLLADLLAGLHFAQIEIHHFLGHAPKLIELIQALGVSYDVYIHDYVWICPRITLMSGENGYCGEPEVSDCEICIEKHGSNLTETISVADLRARSRNWLDLARSVMAPSNDVAKRLARYFPKLRPQVVPWEATVETTAPIAPHGTIIRVALIGAINASKGYGVLLECARDAAARNLGLEFLVIGYTENDEPLMQTGKAFVTGKYGEEEVAGLLARERPHFALFPSMWPETWCFALTHALRANLPIIAFDIGAIAERLRAAGTGTLVSATTSPGKLNDLILSMVVKDGQNKTLAARPLAKPALGSRKLRNDVLTGARVEVGDQGQNSMIRNEGDLSTQSAADELTATVKPIILQSGLYAFLIGNASPEAGKNAAMLLTPAIQVTAGPGVPADAVEFMPALPARGTWLYQSGDALIANVKSKSATVLITSIRAPGSQPLAIKIERIGESAGATLPATARARQAGGSKAAAEPSPHSDVRLEILAHIQNRGDLRFVDVPWAGRVGPGLAIEAFSITALEPLSSGDIEYKGLTATGFETPWVSNNALCGTKGKSTPLIGFAFRLGPEAAEQFDCEYFGYFRSGKTVGPLRNGKPCRSTSSNDPLEGISIRLISKNEADAGDEVESESTFQQDSAAQLEFGKFRDILESGDEQAPPTQSARKSPSPKLKRTRS